MSDSVAISKLYLDKLEAIASVAEEIWLLSDSNNIGERIVSSDLFDKLYLALQDLAGVEGVALWLNQNRWDSCLEKNSIPSGHNSLSSNIGARELRKDVKRAVRGLDGGEAIALCYYHHKLEQLERMARLDLCPAWAVIGAAQKVVSLARADTPVDDIKLADIMDEVLPNWREIRDYMNLKQEQKKRETQSLSTQQSD